MHSEVVGKCPVVTLIVSHTVVAIHCTLAYYTKMAVHGAPELRDKMRARCTVHLCKLLYTNGAHDEHVGYFASAPPAPVCAPTV